MAKFFDKFKTSFYKACDNSFIGNIANIILVIVALVLIISLMLNPAFLVALALFGLFIWAFLYC